MIFLRIENLSAKKLVGKKVTMSIVNNRTMGCGVVSVREKRK